MGFLPGAMVKKSKMPPLWTTDAFLSQESLQSHGEGDIFAAPIRIGMGGSEKEGDLSHQKKRCKESHQGVEALDKPCLGFSVCTWYQELASQPIQTAAEDGCGAISILTWQPKLIPHSHKLPGRRQKKEWLSMLSFFGQMHFLR